jgi:hypothetical protein
VVAEVVAGLVVAFLIAARVRVARTARLLRARWRSTAAARDKAARDRLVRIGSSAQVMAHKEHVARLHATGRRMITSVKQVRHDAYQAVWSDDYWTIHFADLPSYQRSVGAQDVVPRRARCCGRPRVGAVEVRQ